MVQMPTYIVAVSGGVDSVTLLHMLVAQSNHELVVVHFDHGIRKDSHEDAQFVRDLAKEYGLRYEMRREELGPLASEETARTRRYAFLYEVVKKYSGVIVTAHHADDVIETIAINLTRGTGWRGLAVLDSPIRRPLLYMTKQEIVQYAKEHSLAWHEDSTNGSEAYLRNRIRRKTSSISDDDKLQTRALHAQQIHLKKEIDSEVKGLVGGGPDYSRYFFSHQEPLTAKECLRFVTRGRLTRPQCERALLTIKTAKAGSRLEAGAGVIFRFTSRHFSIELVK
jgi:tRNA(Ile)-lysidine synthase